MFNSIYGSQSVDLLRKLNGYASTTEATATTEYTLTDFNAAGRPQGATVLLRNADFAEGTLRIVASGVYKLAENVTFNPNPSDDSMPKVSQASEYPPKAYVLGFFAAITVETSDVVIDLNGKTIEQSPLHALQQRFFSIIELADQPFAPNGAGGSQGPANFGGTIDPASRVVIRNGMMGRSSHFGIHGNGMTEVLIENLNIFDFEVAAIQLNGGKDCMIHNVHVNHSRQDVPVLGTYSSARFIRKHVQKIISRDANLALAFKGGAKKGSELLAALDTSLAAVKTAVLAGNLNFTGDAAIFKNTPKNTDGSVYGIVIHPMGVAVNGFMNSQPSTPTENIVIENVSISGLNSTNNEVVAVNVPGSSGSPPSYANSSVQIGPAGDVFQIDKATTTANGTYKHNVLADVKLFIAKHGSGSEERGTTNITDAIINWALAEDVNISSVITGNPLYRVHNGDSMHHSMKGNIGLFVSGGANILISNFTIDGVKNAGPGGAGSAYTTSHSAQTLSGYGGATSRGIVITSCKDSIVTSVAVENITSARANAVGIDMIGANTNVDMYDCSVKNIMSATSGAPSPRGPNQPPLCHPARVRNSSSTVQFNGRCPAVLRD